MLEWLGMWEMILLGAVQGIAEWLPVSSEGLLVLLQTNLFEGVGLVEAVQVALFLHLGTWLASVVYFWSDVKQIAYEMWTYRSQSRSIQRSVQFYVIATVISGALAFGILKMLQGAEGAATLPGDIINGAIGILLLITGWLQLAKGGRGYRTEIDLNPWEGIIAGIGQGLAALPGISRSGTTTAVLFLRKFQEVASLRVSFIMSIPIVLLGNIVLNLNSFSITGPAIVGFIVAFVFGLLTIRMLLRVAERINFGWLVIGFALLLGVAIFVG